MTDPIDCEICLLSYHSPIAPATDTKANTLQLLGGMIVTDAEGQSLDWALPLDFRLENVLSLYSGTSAARLKVCLRDLGWDADVRCRS